MKNLKSLLVILFVGLLAFQLTSCTRAKNVVKALTGSDQTTEKKQDVTKQEYDNNKLATDVKDVNNTGNNNTSAGEHNGVLPKFDNNNPTTYIQKIGNDVFAHDIVIKTIDNYSPELTVFMSGGDYKDGVLHGNGWLNGKLKSTWNRWIFKKIPGSDWWVVKDVPELVQFNFAQIKGGKLNYSPLIMFSNAEWFRDNHIGPNGRVCVNLEGSQEENTYGLQN